MICVVSMNMHHSVALWVMLEYFGSIKIDTKSIIH